VPGIPEPFTYASYGGTHTGTMNILNTKNLHGKCTYGKIIITGKCTVQRGNIVASYGNVQHLQKNVPVVT
jgi:NADH:ubiquinone oxidoreductase subunit B-like Fe-S oxidoreductase